MKGETRIASQYSRVSGFVVIGMTISNLFITGGVGFAVGSRHTADGAYRESDKSADQEPEYEL